MLKKILILICGLVTLFCVDVFATDNINEAVYDELKELDTQIEGFNFYDFTKELTESNEPLDAKNIFEKIIELITGEVGESFKIIVKLIIPILLFGILSSLTLKKGEEGVTQSAFLACYAVICGIAIYVFYNGVDIANRALMEIDVLTKSMIPVLFSVVAATGNLSAITFVQPTVFMASQIMISVIHNLIFPLILLSFALQITDNITKVPRLKYFSELINKIVKWSLIFMISIFITMVTTNSLVSGSLDAVKVKGTKFAVGSFIPVVGSAMAEGVETIGTSLMLIKNTTGIAGIIGIIAITITPVIKIYAICFMFWLVSAICQPLCEERFSGMLNNIGTTMSLLGVTVICMAFIFIVFISVVLQTTTSTLFV